MNHKPTEVALAIIAQQNNYLVQLRDNIPTIVHPATWALFGGHLELGETPESALVREIKEEINYEVTSFVKFATYAEKSVIRHVFHIPLTTNMENLTLYEGWDFALVTPSIIISGQHYSPKAKAVKPFANIHQQILLDFLSTKTA